MSQASSIPPPPALDPMLCPPAPGSSAPAIPPGSPPVSPGPSLPSCALTPACWQQWYADAQLSGSKAMVTALEALTSVMAKIEQSLEDKLFTMQMSVQHCQSCVTGELERRLAVAESKVEKCCAKVGNRLNTLMGEVQGRLATVGIFPTPMAPITEHGPYGPIQGIAPDSPGLPAYNPAQLSAGAISGPAQPAPGDLPGNGAGASAGGSHQPGVSANAVTGAPVSVSGGNAGGPVGASVSSPASSSPASSSGSSGPAPVLAATGKVIDQAGVRAGTPVVNLGGGQLWIDSQSHPVQVIIQCFGVGDIQALIDALRAAGVIPAPPEPEVDRLEQITLYREPPRTVEDVTAE